MKTKSAGPSKLSVVQVCAPARVGGLETVVQGLARGLADRGHAVTLVCVVPEASAADSLVTPLQDSPVTPTIVEAPNRSYLREIRALSSIMDRQRPDVLHTHGYRADLLHGGRARRKGIATISTLHGSSKMGGLSRFFELIQERALRRFDGVVAVSRPLVDLLARRGVPRERIHYIPNGWSPQGRAIPRREARRLLGLPEVGGPIIGWIGRLIPVKGPDVFVRSLTTVLDGRCLACVIGDGPEREALEKLAGQLGIAPHLRWTGAVPQASRFFSAFDLIVLSSRSEGTPLVIVEAMAQGVPIIATAVGGVPDLIEPPDSGWLVPPEDPARLSAAIRECLADPLEAEARASRGMTRVLQDLSLDKWIGSHEEAYEAAISIRQGC